MSFFNLIISFMSSQSSLYIAHFESAIHIIIAHSFSNNFAIVNHAFQAHCIITFFHFKVSHSTSKISCSTYIPH